MMPFTRLYEFNQRLSLTGDWREIYSNKNSFEFIPDNILDLLFNKFMLFNKQIWSRANTTTTNNNNNK